MAVHRCRPASGPARRRGQAAETHRRSRAAPRLRSRSRGAGSRPRANLPEQAAGSGCRRRRAPGRATRCRRAPARRSLARPAPAARYRDEFGAQPAGPPPSRPQRRAPRLPVPRLRHREPSRRPRARRLPLGAPRLPRDIRKSGKRSSRSLPHNVMARLVRANCRRTGTPGDGPGDAPDRLGHEAGQATRRACRKRAKCRPFSIVGRGAGRHRRVLDPPAATKRMRCRRSNRGLGLTSTAHIPLCPPRHSVSEMPCERPAEPCARLKYRINTIPRFGGPASTRSGRGLNSPPGASGVMRRI